jgi:hypothetical protein
MERYTMFMDWKTQDYQAIKFPNWYIDSTQLQLKSQQDFFWGRKSYQLWQVGSKIYMEKAATILKRKTKLKDSHYLFSKITTKTLIMISCVNEVIDK